MPHYALTPCVSADIGKVPLSTREARFSFGFTNPKDFFSTKMLPEEEEEHRFTWTELT